MCKCKKLKTIWNQLILLTYLKLNAIFRCNIFQSFHRGYSQLVVTMNSPTIVHLLFCSLIFIHMRTLFRLSFVWFKFLLAVRVKKKEEISKTRTNYSMYDNYYCGQSLINERKSTHSLQQTNKEKKRCRKKMILTRNRL